MWERPSLFALPPIIGITRQAALTEDGIDALTAVERWKIVPLVQRRAPDAVSNLVASGIRNMFPRR